MQKVRKEESTEQEIICYVLSTLRHRNCLLNALSVRVFMEVHVEQVIE
jgi:hypothetical protein